MESVDPAWSKMYRRLYWSRENPAEGQPPENQPADVNQPAEGQPADVNQPAEGQPADVNQPAEGQPADANQQDPAPQNENEQNLSDENQSNDNQLGAAQNNPIEPGGSTQTNERFRQSTIRQRPSEPFRRIKFPTEDFKRFESYKSKDDGSQLFISSNIGQDSQIRISWLISYNKW